MQEWLEILKRDFSHPSIIGWCPFNESYHEMVLDPEVFKSFFESMKENEKAFHCPIPRYVGDAPRRPIEYKGQPYWVSELVDVEEEQNGLYFYDRTPKFSPWVYERIREINLGTATVEELTGEK